MRSLTKTGGVALAVLLGLAALTACSPQGTGALDASTVSCEQVVSELETATASLKESKESLEDAQNTPASMTIEDEVETAQANVTALEERSQECSEGNDDSAESASTDDSCEAAYTQVASNNENNRVIGDFSVRYAKVTAEADNLSDGQRTVLLEESGKDAFVLSVWTHAFGLYEDPKKWEELVDGDCLSSEGIKLHNQLEGVLSASGTTFEEAEAPANGFNSGVHDGVYGVASDQGVNGDRKAIKVTLKDGTVVYIMVRCGNPVFPGKPGLPEVPTDNPPKPTPPPVVDCPPGQVRNENGVCVTPKSTNPNDYRRPGDGGKGQDVGTGTKPVVPPVTTPPETTPPKVETSKPGGGGVVDTPTKSPGSETGVTAPGATAPPKTPSAPPPNEGSDDPGTVEEEEVEQPSW